MNESRLGPDITMRDAVIATACELTKYLVEQRDLEQKRWTRSLATSVFFLSMGLTYIGVHALASHDSAAQPTKRPAVDLQRVQLSTQANSPTRTDPD